MATLSMRLNVEELYYLQTQENKNVSLLQLVTRRCIRVEYIVKSKKMKTREKG